MKPSNALKKVISSAARNLLLLMLLLIIAVPFRNIHAQSISNETESVQMDSAKSLSNAYRLYGKLGGVKVPAAFKGSYLSIYMSNDTTTANFKRVFLRW